jgi:hypothetical protein
VRARPLRPRSWVNNITLCTAGSGE